MLQFDSQMGLDDALPFWGKKDQKETHKQAGL